MHDIPPWILDMYVVVFSFVSCKLEKWSCTSFDRSQCMEIWTALKEYNQNEITSSWQKYYFNFFQAWHVGGLDDDGYEGPHQLFTWERSLKYWDKVEEANFYELWCSQFWWYSSDFGPDNGTPIKADCRVVFDFEPQPRNPCFRLFSTLSKAADITCWSRSTDMRIEGELVQ